MERKKILQLIVKEILIGSDELIIKHSIPTSKPLRTNLSKSYLLCTGSKKPSLTNTNKK